MKAYILINTQIGKTTEVVKELSEMKEVKKLDIIMGPYDIIAEVETDNHDTLSRIVINRMQRIDAINHTMTCPVVAMEDAL
ncbi:Transcriptional regulator, AsnC family [Dissulfuribacter thermophilus]|uniref:Transcriptional regulator, AsnC family n=1 Tax=Dissulfuribacter thermophilus TaxID=1156395 RepID=A0A1B9F839_9BACT|nr:Lrp/AsnC ligand binding domain-containing protein [Dissulfuribacter thermophilus]OCC16082.1 Transcriptional regulator, AsnC family [Dissulfuribacter thermophilus]